MRPASYQHLNSMLKQCRGNPVALRLLDELDRHDETTRQPAKLNDIIALYREAIPEIEKQLEDMGAPVVK